VYTNVILGILQVCWIPIFKGKKLILAGDPMQLPPTILSIDMQDRKLKIKAGSFVIQASRNDTVGKTEWSKLDSKSKTAQPSSEVVEVSIEPQVPSDSDSDSEISSDGDQMLDEDEPALVMPSNSPSNIEIVDTSKTKAKTNCTGLKPPRTLETTLFDRLEMMYGLGIKRMLTVQYRSVTTHIFLSVNITPVQNALSNMRISVQDTLLLKIDIT
jgi:DNA polymerase alpha-associated DNA helicase A